MSNKHNKVMEQLGMGANRANAKLKNEVVLWLARLCGKDACFRCGQKIERADDLAMDHKEPWLDVSPDLFWDIENNIAFSHRLCNSLHSRRNRNIFAPPGKAWCCGHQAYLTVDRFHRSGKTGHGWRAFCKDCRREGRDGDKSKLPIDERRRLAARNDPRQMNLYGE